MYKHSLIKLAIVLSSILTTSYSAATPVLSLSLPCPTDAQLAKLKVAGAIIPNRWYYTFPALVGPNLCALAYNIDAPSKQAAHKALGRADLFAIIDRSLTLESCSYDPTKKANKNKPGLINVFAYRPYYGSCSSHSKFNRIRQ